MFFRRRNRPRTGGMGLGLGLGLGAGMLMQRSMAPQRYMGNPYHMGNSYHMGGMMMPRRCMWNPWYSSNWLVRRSFRRDMVRRSCVVPLAPTVPIHETIIVSDPSNQLMVLPAESHVSICSQHVLADLPEITEVVFDQGGRRTVLYADRKCIKCGQFFFCYPAEAPPPYSIPSASAPTPGPSQVHYAPPTQTVHSAPQTQFVRSAPQAQPQPQPQPQHQASPHVSHSAPYPPANNSFPPEPSASFSSAPSAPPPAYSAQNQSMGGGNVCFRCGFHCAPNATFCGGCGQSMSSS